LTAVVSWTQGRLLDGITDSAGTNVSFKYDDNGIRYQKSLTNSAGASYNVNYYLDGAKIIAEERNGVFIDYFYNQNGVVGMRLNNKNYIFLKDALGSIG